MNTIPVLATAHPLFAVAGTLLVIGFVFGMMKRLVKLALFLLMVGGLAWVIYFAG